MVYLDKHEIKMVSIVCFFVWMSQLVLVLLSTFIHGFDFKMFGAWAVVGLFFLAIIIISGIELGKNPEVR